MFYDNFHLLQAVQNERRLNSDQKTAYDAVITTINNNKSKMICLDATRSTKKSF